MNNKVRFQVTLTKELLGQLFLLAQSRNVGIGRLIREILEEFVKGGYGKT